MNSTSVKDLLTAAYYKLRDTYRAKGIPFYLTVAQFGRISSYCVDPLLPKQPALEEYLATLPEGSPFPEVVLSAVATQATSKTLFWEFVSEKATVTPEPEEPPTEVISLPPKPPAPPVEKPQATRNPRLMAYFATLRQRIDGSGVPFRISLEDLGKVPHRLRGSSFPLQQGLLEMPAHYPPIVTMLNRARGFALGNLVWDANGYVEA
jgi:hypothetical protein